MYHVGKAVKIIHRDKDTLCSDNSTQAMIEMWDEMKFIVKVDDSLAEQVKANDFVLVDYTPLSLTGPSPPKQLITKILRGKNGKEIWEEFKKYKLKMDELKKTKEAEGNPYAR